MPEPELIRTEDVARRYRMGGETIEALRGVNLVIRRGDYTAIMGPSGSRQVDADEHHRLPRRPRRAAATGWTA